MEVNVGAAMLVGALVAEGSAVFVGDTVAGKVDTGDGAGWQLISNSTKAIMKIFIQISEDNFILSNSAIVPPLHRS
jgi:hypothetical protein